MTINTSSFAKALWPGLNKIFQDDYKMYAPEHLDFAYKIMSDKSKEEYLGFVGLGLAAIKAQGSATRFQDMEQGFVPSVTNVSFGLGYNITREMRDDNQYMQIATAWTKALARSARITKETVGANMLNRGFDSNYTGSDGVELFSTAHLTKTGLTYANELATPADFSEASLEDAINEINLFTDERGLRIACQPVKLIVHPYNQWEACRVLESDLQSGTAYNDVNAVKTKSAVSGGYAVNHYLTDEDAWFLTTDITKMGQGLIYQERIKDEFASDNEFTTDNAQFKYYGRYAFDWLDPRGAFGVPGA